MTALIMKASLLISILLKTASYVNELHAEKRFYHTARSMMTEAAIDRGFTRDLYVAMGEQFRRY